MSITIDDMKMPKSCMVCPFEHNGDCYGGKPKRIMDIEDFKDSRHLDCPLVDTEPIKHGRWRHYEGTLTCSVCHTEIYDDIMELLGDDVPRYCPNCGADMREVEE